MSECLNPPHGSVAKLTSTCSPDPIQSSSLPIPPLTPVNDTSSPTVASSSFAEIPVASSYPTPNNDNDTTIGIALNSKANEPHLSASKNQTDLPFSAVSPRGSPLPSPSLIPSSSPSPSSSPGSSPSPSEDQHQPDQKQLSDRTQEETLAKNPETKITDALYSLMPNESAAGTEIKLGSVPVVEGNGSQWHSLLPSSDSIFRDRVNSVKAYECVNRLAMAITKMLTDDILAEVIEGIETLHVYAKNLARYPGDARFQSISATNIHFRERLGHLTASQEAMGALGYTLCGDAYRLESSQKYPEGSPDAIRAEAEDQERIIAVLKFLTVTRNNLREHFAMLPNRLPLTHNFTSVRGVGWAADRGRRASMEDDEIIVDCFCGDPHMGYFGLYDGHGGRETVDFVVKTLHANLSHALQALKNKRGEDTAAAHQSQTASGTHPSLRQGMSPTTPTSATASSSKFQPGKIETDFGAVLDTAQQVECASICSDSGESVMSSGSSRSTSSGSERGNGDSFGSQASQGTNGQTSVSPTPAPSLSTFASALRTAYLRTDGQLRRVGILRSGSTSVSCVIRQIESPSPGPSQTPTLMRSLVVANVGDSRAVLCRGGVALRLTVDHRASRPEEAQRIRAAGGFVSPNQRVNGILAVSRALGDHLLKENGHPIVTAAPHCVETLLSPKDRFVILACDGLWDVMSDQAACDFVQSMLDKEAMTSGTSERPYTSFELNSFLCRVAEALVKAAIDRLSKDNITAIIILL